MERSLRLPDFDLVSSVLSVQGSFWLKSVSFSPWRTGPVSTPVYYDHRSLHCGPCLRWVFILYSVFTSNVRRTWPFSCETNRHLYRETFYFGLARTVPSYIYRKCLEPTERKEESMTSGFCAILFSHRTVTHFSLLLYLKRVGMFR